MTQLAQFTFQRGRYTMPAMPRIKKTPSRSPLIAAVLLLAVATALCVYGSQYIPTGFFSSLFVLPNAAGTLPAIDNSRPIGSSAYVTTRDVYCLEHPGDDEDLALGVVREGVEVQPTGRVDGQMIEIVRVPPRYRATCWIYARFVVYGQ